MPNDWDPRPNWQKQGRTGPNGPKYAKRSDRNLVRSGKGNQVGQPKKGCGKAAAVIFIVMIGTSVGLFAAAVHLVYSFV